MFYWQYKAKNGAECKREIKLAAISHNFSSQRKMFKILQFWLFVDCSLARYNTLSTGTGMQGKQSLSCEPPICSWNITEVTILHIVLVLWIILTFAFSNRYFIWRYSWHFDFTNGWKTMKNQNKSVLFKMQLKFILPLALSLVELGNGFKPVIIIPGTGGSRLEARLNKSEVNHWQVICSY